MRVLHKSGALGGVPLRFASGIINTGAIRAWKEGDLRSNAAHGGDTGAIKVFTLARL